ncbi:hypothetical protein [Dyadobacter aurulentus]|uniref:hypothetical protein n=1 Tax=Dyadobacter sp. UC 10 TaxID=2605428 RepID=UPI0011F3B01E|nr:hypothetical protein [Dyadobacter sp. UC 10]KAA0992697.1 hypothetical protein FXO21_22250 [Dyadobacter sp. UC 10]
MEEIHSKILITNIMELNKLLGNPRLYPQKKVIEVQIPQLQHQENEDLTRRINHYQNSCGCKEGLLFGLICLLLFLILSFANGKPLSLSLTGLSVGSFIAGAVIGKFGTMLFLRIGIRIYLDHLFTKTHKYDEIGMYSNR